MMVVYTLHTVFKTPSTGVGVTGTLLVVGDPDQCNDTAQQNTQCQRQRSDHQRGANALDVLQPAV